MPRLASAVQALPNPSRTEASDLQMVRSRPTLLQVMLDVGGLSGANGLLDALALMRQLAATFAPALRCVVIKSTCVRAAAMQLRPVRELVGRPTGEAGRATAAPPPS